MKNMMIALCMLTISYAANAQYDPAVRFGIKAGANLSNINGSNDLSLSPGGNAFDFRDNDNRSLGFAGGVFFRFGKTLYIQPEILLSQKGGKFNVYEDGVLNDGKVDVRFSNLDVPVLFGVRIAKFFRVNVGPMASLRLNKNGKIGDSFDDVTGGNSGAEFKNRLAFGYQAGVGLDLGRLSLDVRYEGNFTDVMKIQFDNATTASQFGKKSNLFQATLGLAIF
ncbi:PorT family protein [Dyadobacter sp. CY399]|uniref:PorT family protein n=2 Tax=Dyadobacter fanqingshengii TaxID=2906443 RepID=A0A9X1P7X8_9BACT|nr:porin family protein [Dyadobacter fanqingshengii]MCF0040396.1 PorT family protein [Dyadobacter fanqingshengii]